MHVGEKYKEGRYSVIRKLGWGHILHRVVGQRSNVSIYKYETRLTLIDGSTT